MKRICVFCSSSARIDRAYFEATEGLARLFVEEEMEVVFGGGSMGLMGKLADVVLENGGKIRGVMPKFMREIEWAHKGVTDFVFTETMEERKAAYLEGVEGLVALPGGSGTLEEIFQVISLKRLGLLTAPIVILNTLDYFGPLQEMLNRCVAENFMDERHLEMWAFVDEPEDVIDALENAPEWSAEAIEFAVRR